MEKRCKFLLFFAFSFLIFGCERSDKPDSSKLTIRMPSSEAIQSLTSSQKLQGKPPSSLTEVNCFAIMVTGPEPDLRRNACFQVGSAATTSFPVGLARVGIKPEEEISISVPSGQDRVVSLVGFRAQEGACFDWKAANFNPDYAVSAGYVLGTADRLKLDPGGTVEVPIKMSFNTTKWFDRCIGPEFNESGGGGGGGANTNAVLNLKKKEWPEQFMVKSVSNPCIEFELSLQDSLGNNLSLSEGEVIEVGLSSKGLDATLAYLNSPKVFPSSTTCVADAGEVSSVVFDSTTGSRKSLFVRGGSALATAANFKLEATATAKPASAATFVSAVWQRSVQLDTAFSYQFKVVPSAVRGGCYKATIENKTFSGNPQSDSVSLANSGGISLYINSDCTGVLTGFSSAGKTFYFKIDGSAVGNQTITATGGGVPNSVSIDLASGGPNPVAMRISGYNSMPAAASCGPDSVLRVVLLNAMGSPVPSESGSEINFTTAFPTNLFQLKVGSCAGSTFANGASRTIPAGMTEDLLYVSPTGIQGTGSIILHPNGGLDDFSFGYTTF